MHHNASRLTFPLVRWTRGLDGIWAHPPRKLRLCPSLSGWSEGRGVPLVSPYCQKVPFWTLFRPKTDEKGVKTSLLAAGSHPWHTSGGEPPDPPRGACCPVPLPRGYAPPVPPLCTMHPLDTWYTGLLTLQVAARIAPLCSPFRRPRGLVRGADTPPTPPGLSPGLVSPGLTGISFGRIPARASRSLCLGSCSELI